MCRLLILALNRELLPVRVSAFRVVSDTEIGIQIFSREALTVTLPRISTR